MLLNKLLVVLGFRQESVEEIMRDFNRKIGRLEIAANVNAAREAQYRLAMIEAMDEKQNAERLANKMRELVS